MFVRKHRTNFLQNALRIQHDTTIDLHHGTKNSDSIYKPRHSADDLDMRCNLASADDPGDLDIRNKPTPNIIQPPPRAKTHASRSG